MAFRSTSRFQLAAFSLASIVGLALGACAEEPEDCSAGSLNCECIVGQCLPGLQCVANFCFPGSAGDGDGDGDDDDDTSDTSDTNDTNDTSGDCPGGELSCDGQCIDPQIDPDNCGQCGNTCPAGCDAGQCEVVDCTTEKCPAGSFCDLGTHECIPGCAFDGDCTEGTCDIATHTCGFGAGEECDVYAQKCIDGYKCDASASPPICVQLAPNPKQVGESCSLSSDDCATGALCLYLGHPSVGECYGLCGGSADSPSCGGGTLCSLTNPPLCLESCDPLGNDCNVEQGCYPMPVAMEFGCIHSSDDLPLGDSCSFLNACASGLGCNADAVCAEYCLVANPPVDCTCVELFGGVGLCSTF